MKLGEKLLLLTILPLACVVLGVRAAVHFGWWMVVDILWNDPYHGFGD